MRGESEGVIRLFDEAEAFGAVICGRPRWQGLFDVRTGLVGCGHMSGLFGAALMSAGLDEVRRLWSLIIAPSLMLMTARGVSLASVVDHCRSSRLVALAKLLKSGDFVPYALANTSWRKTSPVVMIAQQIRASLLASATATRRSGFLARSAAIQPARAPLRLPATRRTEVQPTTSIVRCTGCPVW